MKKFKQTGKITEVRGDEDVYVIDVDGILTKILIPLGLSSFRKNYGVELKAGDELTVHTQEELHGPITGMELNGKKIF